MTRRVSLSAAVSVLLGLTVLPVTSLAGFGNIEIPSSEAGTEIPSSKTDQLHGGEIMPSSARPHGFSLSDMAADDAQFVTSGNTQSFPTTPFQILFADPPINFSPVQGNGLLETGSNSFSVPPGTMFYVPIATVDDSPLVLGGTFPTSPSAARSYWFDSSQLGGSDSITVDDRTTPIGATYLVGPISTQPLPDGGGTHVITMGVFLTPFKKGTHTVSISTRFDGAFIPQAGFNFIHGEFTYEVTVK
jgi:hypothetical protein